MNAADVILLAVIAAAVGLAVRSMVKRKKNGCSCSCGSCSCQCSQRK